MQNKSFCLFYVRLRQIKRENKKQLRPIRPYFSKEKKQERERLQLYFLVGAHTIINNDEFKAEVEKHLIEMCCGVSASSQ